ncbi:hypothetical protein KEM52_002261 [Ascosphaera acerosa]|nr:hypothetical protein KEM52_002261 [Ascosphaera acerosa]
MSRVPYYLPRGPQLPALGHLAVQDGLLLDGLTDAYDQIHMGACAEATAKKLAISRAEQDAYAVESYRRAQRAWDAGLFAQEVVPVTFVPDRKKKGGKGGGGGGGGEVTVARDEGFDNLKLDKIPTLKPAFVRDGTGTVTAANASTLNDGASAVVLGNRAAARESLARRRSAEAAATTTSQPGQPRPIGRILATADAATLPIDFPIAPSLAVPRALRRAGLAASQVDVWEFNEAFAAVVRANARILGLDGDDAAARVNPRGGAIALGHALGSSGCRILVTLLHELEVGQVGVAVICNGGGAATAMVVQRVDPDEVC